MAENPRILADKSVFKNPIVRAATVIAMPISPGISIMLEAVEKRFGSTKTPHQIDMLTDNGSPYVAAKPASLLAN